MLTSKMFIVSIQTKISFSIVYKHVIIRNKRCIQYNNKTSFLTPGKKCFSAINQFPNSFSRRSFKHDCAPKSITFSPCDENYYFRTREVHAFVHGLELDTVALTLSDASILSSLKVEGLHEKSIVLILPRF